MPSDAMTEFPITKELPEHLCFTDGESKCNDLISRFMNFVEFEPNTGCWLWAGCCTKGYGQFHIGSRIGNSTKTIYSHRFSYETFVGPIPDGMKILHKCDNPPCVNWEHLFLGTQHKNCVDMAIKGRGTKSKNGLPYGTIVKPNGKFQSRVRYEGKLFNLGTFDTPKEAHEIASKKKLELINENN